jgi:hypothetical protein
MSRWSIESIHKRMTAHVSAGTSYLLMKLQLLLLLQLQLISHDQRVRGELMVVLLLRGDERSFDSILASFALLLTALPLPHPPPPPAAAAAAAAAAASAVPVLPALAF